MTYPVFLLADCPFEWFWGLGFTDAMVDLTESRRHDGLLRWPRRDGPLL
ncbi:MAG: hypothetical protein ACF787_05575 [Rhodopirellula sp. JB053]